MIIFFFMFFVVRWCQFNSFSLIARVSSTVDDLFLRANKQNSAQKPPKNERETEIDDQLISW